MGCIVALFAILAPRVVLVLMWLFSDYLSNAYGTWVWPLLGFFFLPLTTIAGAWSIHTYGGVSGAGLLVVILAVLVDLGIIGGSGWGRRRGR